MTLVGVGLLPELEILDSLIEFSERWQSEVGSPRLGRLVNLPHVSVYQLPVRRVEEFIEALEQLGGLQAESTELQELVYQPVGWLFASVVRNSWMLDLQKIVVTEVDQFLDRSAMKQAHQLHGYTEDEKSSYLRHGYRYVGRPFKPHFTIGRTDLPELSLSADCLRDYQMLLHGRAVRFDRVVAYRAGHHGSLAEILAVL